MPRHRNITLVACEECRARKIRCDGTTPVCSACQTKSKTCTYASDPAVPRVAALKTAHKQLESKYDHLRSLYTRLKEADSADALALLEQIRTTDGILELPENPSIWQSSSDTANTSGQASPMVSKEEDLTAIGESRFDVTDFSLTEGPACIPSDTNMHSSSGILHPSLERSDDTGPSVCQWDSRTGKRFDTHISVSHKVFLWPAVYRQFALGGAKTFPDLRPLAWVGSAWLMRKDELGVGNLPCDEVIPFSSITSGCVLFPDLSFAQVENYSAAYFNTFNRLFPILDRNLFVDGVLTRLSRQGYKDDDPESVLALLVCALGQLAREGVFEIPASTSHGEPSGFRGGTTERPPGLSLFNQARRRVGIVATKCSLETVQILLLQGTYFEACARHTEFWSSVSAASMSCMLLVKSQPIHWSSRYGDLVKRAFWICVLHERSINLDFCVADTGIEALAELVPLPHFPDVLDEERVSCNIRTQSIAETKRPTKSDFAYHLSAMISLGQLIRRANDVIHDHEPVIHDITRRAKESSAFANDPPVEGLSDPNDQGQIHFGLVRELAHELESWRKTLPSRFQWSDDRKFDFTEIDPVSELSRSSFFNLAGNAGPEEMDHNVDVAVAHLRTCYYQTRFLVYRPFIYKALHQPKLMTLSDRTNCAFAVEAACHWPISLAPPKNKMHLLPHLFSWTQNFLAILLILKFCLRQGPLHDICQENGVSDSYIRDTFVSMKAWLEDASQVDGIARWGLQVFL